MDYTLWLKKCIEKNCGIHSKDIHDNDNIFKDLDMDSLDYFLVLKQIEENFMISFENVKDKDINTIDKLSNKIAMLVLEREKNEVKN